MPGFRNNDFVEDILRMLGPVNRERRVLFTEETPDGEDVPVREVIEEDNDERVISPEGSLDRVAGKRAHFYGCGHFADSSRESHNLGGRCECGRLVCEACYARCYRCGRGLCPQHRVVSEDGIFCVNCHDELSRASRIRRTLGFIASFFVEKTE